MDKETKISIIIATILSIISISLSSLINFQEDAISWIVLTAGVVLIFIILSINSIKDNKHNIKILNNKIEKFEKDLNIYSRLSKIEEKLRLK